MSLSELEKYLDIVIKYIEIGGTYVAKYVMTVEGIIAIIFGAFLLGLFSRIMNP